jgi:hypothetical protein
LGYITVEYINISEIKLGEFERYSNRENLDNGLYSVKSVKLLETTMPEASSIIAKESEIEPEDKINDLVQAFVGIRDALTEARRKFKEFEARSKEDMAKIEIKLLEKSRKLGVESFKTEFGTAYRTDKDFARVAGPEGWEALCKFMVEHNDFGLVEKRVAKLHFKEIMKELGIAPQEMGVEYVVEEVVRRK